ncbi:GH92 family glycosyl hydrolase [Frateuria aurantia]|uniref:Alpha-1,2-mannosidase, putative n=1 Tax=Frateuria aurantia (strain ATCC 33424 / DSM 6220 / KCTC 2777 / LMG 1558 / NBRC 3245 / NCIMB 13370) TaxID=767434 RepID=H8KZE1_FRAAD|nr:GH92 family glycosyl hydrolase [Frateuria aurantia]AFC86183.1 alpha-1,2-mannosidase, putative [Frateuria aurantia DSM 6220]
MHPRRRFLQQSLAAGVTPLAASPFATAVRAMTDDEKDRALRHVDVFIGTGGHGHTFPGATVPFGMVQLSPDTYNAVWDACSGYHRGDGSIMGFSHTHLSGTGCADLMDIMVMPCVGAVQTEPGQPTPAITIYHSRFDATHGGSDPGQSEHQPRGHTPGYRASFTSADETATPGYYSVILRDRRIKAELTATARVGMHRYTFPASDQSHLLLDLAHGAQDDPLTPAKVGHCHLRVIGNDTLVGSRQVDEWAPGRQIFFALKLSRPFERFEVYAPETAGPLTTIETRGKTLKCALHFSTRRGETILVKTGISAVDIEGALRNLEAEVSGWNFELVRQQASAAWTTALARSRAVFGSRKQQRIFDTAMYHSLVAPTLFSDVDGRYRGMDMSIRQLPEGQLNYTAFSLWDTYRALHPLLTLIQPERVPDLVNSLVRMAAQSPAGVPVWPLQGRETGCMIGYHSAVVVAEAHAKGFAGIDFQAAWPLWRKRAMDDDYRGLALYRQLGYIPADKAPEAVSKTLEYAYDDWAVAELAKAAGADEDRRHLTRRSQNYRNVFDPATGFARARHADGSWIEPFDPRAMGHTDRWRDFTESNAWQATFLNQHDIYHFIAQFGGDAPFVRKLDALFAADSTLPADAPPDIAGMIGQYAHGNEPSHHVAYLYAYAGQPWKTQAMVRRILSEMYDDKPDGEAGNDDCGQMSAWFILNALGFYPVDPVSGIYVLGSPAVLQADLALTGGRLRIVAHDNKPDHVYVQSVRFNGQPHSRNWIRHSELIAGGLLEFEMGPRPNLDFGVEQDDRPPSYT